MSLQTLLGHEAGDDQMVDNLCAVILDGSLEAFNLIVLNHSMRNQWFTAGPMEGERRHQELMNSNQQRIYENLRMNRHVFVNLCNLLERHSLIPVSDCVSAGQQIHIYIRAMGHKGSVQVLAEYFQHSLETISRYITTVMEALKSLFSTYVRLPVPDHIAPRIMDNPKYHPYFKDCIGALDGTQIAATVSGMENPAAFRNRKGFISQNVLIAVSFDMSYLFVLPGWEGSAHDAAVLDDARLRHNFIVPPGKFYLTDAGYGVTNTILSPYRGVRYHLRESYTSGLRPANAKELFNLRHASLRNVVERAIGVLKKRFPVLTLPSYYPYEKQVNNIYALTMISNYIQLHDQHDEFFQNPPLDHSVYEDHHSLELEATYSSEGSHERAAGKALRNKIADEMWKDYKSHLQDHSRRQRQGV